jgi:predicted dehydrogenase
MADVTPANLAQGLKIYGNQNTRGYTDYRELLAKHPDLDAVLVVVPNYLHAEVGIAALESGKNVLTEKPIATSVADGQRMIATAAEHGRALQVGFQSRYATLYHKAAELIQQGAIGKLEMVFGCLFRGDWNPRSWQYTDPATGKSTNWRFLTRTEGSALLEDGIHELDVINWLVGVAPRRIQAQGGNSVWLDRETIDNAGVLVEYANGVRLNFGFSIFTPGTDDHSLLRFYGCEGELSFAEDGGKQYVVTQRFRSKAERIEVPHLLPEEEPVWKAATSERLASESGASTYRLHQAFLNSVSTNSPVFADGHVGLEAARLSLAAEHSLRTGNPVSWEEPL